MLVTVALCTWNRSALLDQTLTRMAELRIPAGIEWELLVVNNNCSDDTDTVITRHASTGRLPLRRVFESQPGLSHARNNAIGATRGEYIIWTDDDVLVAPDWLGNYTEAFRNWPAASFFGGPIRPWFEQPPPAWLPPLLVPCKHLWAVLDLGNESRALLSGESPFGANMAVRTEILHEHRFDTRQGHAAGVLGGGEETTLFAHLQLLGHAGRWVPDASVEHFIPAERMTLEYVRRRAMQFGYQSHDPRNDTKGKQLFGLPGYIVSRYVKFNVLKRLYPIVSRERWAMAEYQASLWKGVIRRVREAKQRRATE